MPKTIGRNSSVSTGRTRDRRADRPANDDAPGAARQLMHHRQRQRAERQPEHEHVGHQVRLEELRRVHEVADDRDHRARRAGQQELPLVLRELGNQC